MKLRRKGIVAVGMHGGLSQGARTARLVDFRSSAVRVLVATDLAARGLDIPKLPAVVNYDLPRSTADFTHRCGRTGRAGESGVAVSFVSAASAPHFRLIEERHLKGASVEREVVDGFEPDERDWLAATASRVGGGGAGGEAPLDVGVPGVVHSDKGLAHDMLHGGVKGRRKSKKDKLRERAAAAAARAARGGGSLGQRALETASCPVHSGVGTSHRTMILLA